MFGEGGGSGFVMGFGMLPFLFGLNLTSMNNFFRGSGNINTNSQNNSAETDF